MNVLKAIYEDLHPYQGDALNLPVSDVEKAVGFYTSIMGFSAEPSESIKGIKRVILSRDGITIGLSENGRDPSQDGCFFRVDDVEVAFAELKSNGLEKKEAEFRVDKYGEKSFKVFFVIAPDGLCFCLGQELTL
jgi:catechol 2,3-dioxygenase-like lactoylglutathione lyase family enzyme